MLVLKFLIRLIFVGTAPIVPTVWNILLRAVLLYIEAYLLNKLIIWFLCKRLFI